MREVVDIKIIINGREFKNFKLTRIDICEDRYSVNYTIEGMVQKTLKELKVEKIKVKKKVEK